MPNATPGDNDLVNGRRRLVPADDPRLKDVKPGESFAIPMTYDEFLARVLASQVSVN